VTLHEFQEYIICTEKLTGKLPV